MNATPYTTHAQLAHDVTRYSPEGVARVAECATCGARFLLQGDHPPVSLRPLDVPYGVFQRVGPTFTPRKLGRPV